MNMSNTGECAAWQLQPCWLICEIEVEKVMGRKNLECCKLVIDACNGAAEGEKVNGNLIFGRYQGNSGFQRRKSCDPCM